MLFLFQAFKGLAAATALTVLSTAYVQGKTNIIVTTDIGGDPDDIQSLRRFLLYSNEFNVLGIIASAAGTPGETDPTPRPDLINGIIDNYNSARGNLLNRASGFPTADSLKSVVKTGNKNRGTTNIGAGKDTEGSNHIIYAVDSVASGQKVGISIWGGATDVAQALYKVRANRSDAEENAFVSKIIINSIGDQDKTAGDPGTLKWIKDNFPNLRVLHIADGIDSFQSLFRGMYQNDSKGGGSAELQLVPNDVISLNQSAWVDSNVRSGHGALGAGYPNVTQNPTSSGNTSGCKEGDTPSWFYFLPNGLSDINAPTWGNWGGRFHGSGQRFADAQDAHYSGNNDPALRRKWTVARWRKHYQNDFQARMDWCNNAGNRAPVARLNGDASRNVLSISVYTGATVGFNSNGTTDPDGNSVSYRWWIYKDASSYSGSVSISNATSQSASLIVPSDAGGKSIHVILEVSDGGSPSLVSYRRLILNCQQSGSEQVRVEAESRNVQSGTVNATGDGGTVVDRFSDGDYLGFNNINFGSSGVSSLHVRVASGSTSNPVLEVRLNSQTGTLLGSVPAGTGGWGTYQTKSISIPPQTGARNIYLVSPNGGLLLNWWQFNRVP